MNTIVPFNFNGAEIRAGVPRSEMERFMELLESTKGTPEFDAHLHALQAKLGLNNPVMLMMIWAIGRSTPVPSSLLGMIEPEHMKLANDLQELFHLAHIRLTTACDRSARPDERSMYPFVSEWFGAKILAGPSQPDLLIPSTERNPNGIPIECKVGTATQRAVDQLAGYMREMDAIEGILIAPELSSSAKLAPGITYHRWASHKNNGLYCWEATGITASRSITTADLA